MQYGISVIHPGRTMDDFRKVMEILEGSEPDGLIVRLVGTDSEGLRVISVWESKAKADRFAAEQLGPALAKVFGASNGPQISEIEVEEVFISRTSQPQPAVEHSVEPAR